MVMFWTNISSVPNNFITKIQGPVNNSSARPDPNYSSFDYTKH